MRNIENFRTNYSKSTVHKNIAKTISAIETNTQHTFNKDIPLV